LKKGTIRGSIDEWTPIYKGKNPLKKMIQLNKGKKERFGAKIKEKKNPPASTVLI